ncbi:MAG TPA: tetratricopeptide repeat protein [Chloroflexota bacterium]
MAAEVAAIGAALRRHRIAAGLTQEELAEKAGLSTRGIQDLERGARRAPHPETLRRLSHALGRDDDSMLTDLETGKGQPLPVALSSFVGRERDVAEVATRLRHARLVTLAGTGGIGKTRLALAVAGQVNVEYEDGAWLAELGPLADGGLVLPCVATALGVREQFLRPLLETLCTALADRSLLLVLDNCEHVLDACAVLLGSLLRACPGVRVLATSRQPLRVEGESIWRVPPLTVPELGRPVSIETLAAHGATRLFLERAQPSPAMPPLSAEARRAIATICQRLDGVPLAIELAAARAPTFTFEQIALRLDDAIGLLSNGSRSAPPRHRTLQATIEWSVGLLTEPEQMLLERIAAFAGGFTLEAVEHVAAGNGLDSGDVLDLLSQLTDKSLVVAEPSDDGTTRYQLQEVLRQFGQDRLTRRAPEVVQAVSERHARYYLQLVEAAEPEALGKARRRWLDRLEQELENFRAARRWFVAHADAEGAQRLCASLYRLLVYRGHASEGRASLLEALALPGGSAAARAKALHFLGSLAWTQGDFAAAREYQQEALTLRRQLGDQTGMAWSLAALGIAATMLGQFDIAEPLLEEGCRTSRAGDDHYIHGLSLSLSGLTAYLRGDKPTALEQARAAMDVATDHGFPSIRCMALTTIGCVSFLDGALTSAISALESALATAEAVGEVYLIERAALNLAMVATALGDPVRARSLLAEGVGLAQQLGNRHHLAQALEGVAAFAADRDAESAFRFAGAAATVRAVIGVPLSPTERQLLERRLGPPEARGSAFDLGRLWSLEEAAEHALEYVERGAYAGTGSSGRAGA